MNLDKVREALLEKLSDHQMVDCVRELQKIFIERKDMSQYGHAKELVSAYASFYMLTNIPKLFFIFDQIKKRDESLWAKILSLSFCDWGCGTGTYTWAFLEYLKEQGLKEKQLFAYDNAPVMKEQFFRLKESLYAESSIEWKEGKGGTLCLGNALNEIHNDLFNDILKRVCPDVLILIEPGTKEQFSRLKEMRETLLKSFDIAYPCLGSSSCPTRTNDWCHQVVRPDFDQETHRIMQLSKVDRRTLPMCAHVYIRKGFHEMNSSSEAEILFKYRGRGKFSHLYDTCSLSADHELKIRPLYITKKGNDSKRVKGLQVGEFVKVERSKDKGILK